MGDWMSPLGALALAALALSLGSASKCPSVPVVDPLCADKLNGTWYQKGEHNTVVFQGAGKCVKATYTKQPDGSFLVLNEQKSLFLGVHTNIKGFLVLADPKSTKGILNVTLSTPVGNRTSQLEVVATNCKDILILHACTEFFGLYSFQVGWILSKNQSASWGELKTTVTPWLQPSAKSGGLNITDFRETVQTGCD